MKKHFGKIKLILNIIIAIMVVAFLIVVCLQRFSNNEISFFNYRMFTVASGSMAPQYNVGDVLIAKETAPEDVEVGDSVTYLGTYGSFANKVVTHEVTSIEKDVNGEYIFHTKGIANLVEDPPVHESQLYGVIVWRPIILSFVYKLVSTKFGLFIFVIIPIFYIIGSEIIMTMLDREEERRRKLKEKENKEDDDNKEKDKDDNKDNETKEEQDDKEQKEEISEEKELKEEKVEQEEKPKTKKKSTKKTKKSEEPKEEKSDEKETKEEVKEETKKEKKTTKKTEKKKKADKKTKQDK